MALGETTVSSQGLMLMEHPRGEAVCDTCPVFLDSSYCCLHFAENKTEAQRG
jgi:hypothetical protein